MVNRNYLKCLSCGHETMTRTALGHADYQEFAFACSGCGVEIRYGMNLDQANAGFSYTKPVNAEWIESKKEPGEIDIQVFDTETLIPRDLGNFFSPFIRVSILPKNPVIYQQDKGVRMELCQRVWPVIRKMKVHFENRNWELYRRTWQEVEPDFSELREPWLIAHCLRHIHRFGAPFRPFSDGHAGLLRQRINLAEIVHPELCEDLRRYLDGIGWVESLYSELMSIKDKWIKAYGIVQPIYISLYWDETKNNLDDYVVSQKRFDELKPLFVDCFETLSRISVIAAAFEGMIFNAALCVPRGNKAIDVDDFRGIENGRKFEILQHLVPASCFRSLASSKLRNGIGHHSAHYNAKEDIIEYRKENKKGVQRERISYTRFCEALVKLYGQFDVASVYINWAVAKKAGLKGRVV